MVARSTDGLTLVLNDAVFNTDRERDLLGSAPGPRVSGLAKLALIKDKKALRRDLELHKGKRAEPIYESSFASALPNIRN